MVTKLSTQCLSTNTRLLPPSSYSTSIQFSRFLCLDATKSLYSASVVKKLYRIPIYPTTIYIRNSCSIYNNWGVYLLRAFCLWSLHVLFPRCMRYYCKFTWYRRCEYRSDDDRSICTCIKFLIWRIEPLKHREYFELLAKVRLWPSSNPTPAATS